METVESGAMCSGSADMPLGVYVLIGKSRKMKGSWLLRSSPSVSPEEGLFKFGSVPPVFSYTQMADEGSRDGVVLGQAILRSQLRL